MRQRIIAKRYARALADALRDGDGLEEARECLDALAEALATEPEAMAFFRNPQVKEERKADALAAALEGTDASETLRAFVRVLCEARRAGLLPLVAEEFGMVADRAAGVLRGRLSTAVPLDEQSVEKLRHALSKRTGKDVRLQAEVDESLLAGIAVRIGNAVYDASLRGRLEGMKRHFRVGEAS